MTRGNRPVHQDYFEPALKQMPHQRVALVECLGVHAVHMPHQTRQIGLARVQHQVTVTAIWQQANT